MLSGEQLAGMAGMSLTFQNVMPELEEGMNGQGMNGQGMNGQGMNPMGLGQGGMSSRIPVSMHATSQPNHLTAQL